MLVESCHDLLSLARPFVLPVEHDGPLEAEALRWNVVHCPELLHGVDGEEGQGYEDQGLPSLGADPDEEVCEEGDLPAGEPDQRPLADGGEEVPAALVLGGVDVKELQLVDHHGKVEVDGPHEEDDGADYGVREAYHNDEKLGARSKRARAK